MKKILLVIATVLALIIGTYVADRATRLQPRATNSVVKAGSPVGEVGTDDQSQDSCNDEQNLLHFIPQS